MDEFIKKIPKVGKIYKTVEEAYGALLKGFRSIKNRDPDLVENEMLKAEAKGKIKEQGDNISILDDQRKFAKLEEQGIMSQAPGTKKPIDELEDYTISDEDVVQNLVDQKFGKGYFDNVEEVSFAPGMDKRGKMVKESPSQRQADLDRPFVTEDEMSAFTMEENARKLNKAKGFIDKLGAKSTRQKLFIADLVEDAGTGVFQDVDMGAVVRSNMFDDLLEQGIDDDLLTNIMYSGTKSDDFTTTLAKIKSNARDEGVDIDETVDFYERVFDEVARVKKAMGGRIGYAEGNDDPKKLIKKIPKVGKTVSGIESLKGAISKIMNRFGEDAITTADKVDQPEKTTQQLISEFESRNKPDAIKIESREILDVPPVPSGFKLSKEKLMTKFPELDEDFANNIMDMDKDTQGRIIKMLENRRLDPEAYDRLLAEYGDTLEFQAEFDKVTRRKNNNQGGLNYLMGL
jgi:hypothetical protein